MKSIFRLFTLCCVLLMFSVCSFAKQWRGIVPLHSTRADVERILGNPINDFCKCVYNTKEARISVVYSFGNCEKGGTGGWDIKPDTVINFTVYPKSHPKLSDLKINENKFTKDEDVELPGIFHYFNEKEGFGITVEDGIVRDFNYTATAKDKVLRCPK